MTMEETYIFTSQEISWDVGVSAEKAETRGDENIDDATLIMIAAMRKSIGLGMHLRYDEIRRHFVSGGDTNEFGNKEYIHKKK